MDNFYYNGENTRLVEILKNRLYFGVLRGTTPRTLRNTSETLYFNTDNEFVYMNFYYDFGPLNISCLYKYCSKLNNYLQSGKGFKRIIHYTTADPQKRANAAYLIGCFAIIYLKMDPRNVYKILLKSGGRFKDFLDASQGIFQYSITLLDVFQAIAKAIVFKFFDFNDFNVFEYDTYDKLHNGDMNWILPDKFLALIGPTDSYDVINGHSPSFYANYFLKNGIKTVIRLNNKLYNADVFRRVGIEHIELFFPDGTTPPKDILMKFLQITETTPGAFAVHCKAGLGRTGSLIGAYIMKHYRFAAREAIAWMRICRPGSVIGQQQGWLEKIEGWLWKEGRTHSIQKLRDKQIRIRNGQIKSAEVGNRYSNNEENVKKINSATNKENTRVRKVRFQELEKKRTYKETEADIKRLNKILSRPKMVSKAGNEVRHVSTATQKDFVSSSRQRGQQDSFRDPFAAPKTFRGNEGSSGNYFNGDVSKKTSDFVTFWQTTGQHYYPRSNPTANSHKFIQFIKPGEDFSTVKLGEEHEIIRKKGIITMLPKMPPELERTQGDLLNVIKMRRQMNTNTKRSKM